ncbi:MAG: response regulator [Armatimonadetes bacterium]|nr:response regulator [Anaerolineae bacterium]
MLNVLKVDSNRFTPAAESPDAQAQPTHPMEPAQFLKTSTFAVVVLSAGQESLMAETGVLPQVSMTLEGKETVDAQDASLTSDERKPAPLTAPHTLSGKMPTVLIIEDTTELAEIIQATLERINIATLHETHGNRALALLNERKPDVVLLDISLPDTIGWKVLDAMREKYSENQVTLPIIVVISAYGDPANRLAGKLNNIHSYLLKPFTTDEVEKVVLDALNSIQPEDTVA